MLQHKPSTQSSHRSVIGHLINPLLGDWHLSELNTETLQMWVSKLQTMKCESGQERAVANGEVASGNTSRPLSPKTIKNAVNVLRVIWKTARAWGYVHHNPFEGLMLPRCPKPHARFFTDDEVRRIIAAAEEPYKTFYMLLAETGLRAGEAAGLRREDVREGKICVEQSVWRGNSQAPKTGSATRAIPISGQLAARLRDIVSKGVGPVFASRVGTPWIPDLVVKRRLHPLLETLGIERAGLHAFRHYNASVMDSLNMPLKLRQSRLGHADVNLTLNTYTHVQDSDPMYAELISQRIESRVQ